MPKNADQDPATHRVLIANRGEAARRLIRTFRKLEVETIAVYSDADKGALFVEEADFSINIGAAPSNESYLRLDKLIEAGKERSATALHPGWGFLSENPDLATAVESEKWIFIGPTSEQARDLGDKVTARKLAEAAGVPCTPAWSPEKQEQGDAEPSLEDWTRQSEIIGYPLLVKAVSGGGGKGMRIVRDSSALKDAIHSARREALSSFNDDRLFLEKLIEPARHIEVQVVGDGFGDVAILGDRECSLQRRHQKLVEEAPAPHIEKDIRQLMHSAAKNLAISVNYRGAGTVEFLLDSSGENYYFLEMNTRLQVEHPVTEEAYGVDLVELQWLVAIGKKLPSNLDGKAPCAHSIEIRVNAENPSENFIPSTGRLLDCCWPSFEGIRVDSGIRSGDTVTPYYDAMLAKIIATGDSREQAKDRLIQAIDCTSISPLQTSISLGRDLLKSEEFSSGKFYTRMIETDWGEWCSPVIPESWETPLRAMAKKLLTTETKSRKSRQRRRGTCWDNLEGVLP